MNKLRKAQPISPMKSDSELRMPEPMSRTMKLASVNAGDFVFTNMKRDSNDQVSSALKIPAPTSASSREQYWAARALQAETLLSAREGHYHELRNLINEEEAKRTRELSRLGEEYKAKHAAMERLIGVLLLALFSLIALVIYFTTHYMHKDAHRSRWSLPSHFTIPILSPFTSVVEHETSVVGSRTIVTLFALAAGLAYLVIRYRMARRPS